MRLPLRICALMLLLFLPASGAAEFDISVVSGEIARAPRVLVYHTHTFEAYAQTADAPYRQTEKWRTRDEKHNVVRVGAELCAYLTAAGIEATHVTDAFEPPDLESAYARSLVMLEGIDSGYDLYIDLHRDAYSVAYGAQNVSMVGDTRLARVMFLVGRGTGQTGAGFDKRPDWEKNRAVADTLRDALNAQVDGLCLETCLKSGRYNQHVGPACVLVEVGNNRNTLEEALLTMPYLAQAICEYFDGSGE